MKEYWTDTILEKIVPAGTDIERREPVRIYKADDVDADKAKDTTRIQELEGAVGLLTHFVPDEWEMPLGWGVVVAQATKILNK